MHNLKNYSYILALVLATVLFRYLLTVATVNYLPTTHLDQNYEQSQKRTSAPQPSTLPTNEGVIWSISQLWLRWDSGFYLSIIQSGYDKTDYHPGEFKNWVFFPLYPLTVKLISNVFQIQETNTLFIGALGIFLSTIFLYLSLVLLWKLLEILKIDDTTKWLSIVFILFSPGAHFLHLFYTESLFLLLSICALYFLFKQKYLLAFVFLGASTLTRFNGILLYAPFIFYFFVTRTNLRTKEVLKIFVYFGLSLLPLLSYFYYLYTLTNDFFIFSKVQQLTWHNNLVPLGYFTLFLQTFGIGYFFYFLLLLGTLFLMGFAWIKMKSQAWEDDKMLVNIKTLWVYGFINVLFLASLQGNSIHRYLAVVFPLVVLPLYIFRNTNHFYAYVIGSLLFCVSLQVLFFTFFVLDAFVYSY